MDGLIQEIRVQAEHARADASRISALHEEVAVRLRFGLTAFNAASMVALISAAGVAPNFLAALGLSDLETISSVAVFAGGTISGGVSIFLTQQDLKVRAAYADARATNLMTRASAVQNMQNQVFEATGIEALKLFEKVNKHSRGAINAQLISGWSWIIGLTLALALTLW